MVGHKSATPAPRRAVTPSGSSMHTGHTTGVSLPRGSVLPAEAPAPASLLKTIGQRLDGVLSRLQTLSARVKGHADYILGAQPECEGGEGIEAPAPSGRVHEIDQLTGCAHNLLTELEYQVGRLSEL